MGFSLGHVIGKAINSLTGASSSSAKSQKYALQSAAINNQYQKEFAQNAHQWEVEDLEKAGINPILSAGGTGASASGGGVNSATQQSSGITPLDLLNTLVNSRNTEANTGKTKAETEESIARTNNHIADQKLKEINTKMGQIEVLLKTRVNPIVIKQEEQKLQNMVKEYENTQATTGKTRAETERVREETKQKQGGKMASLLGTEPIKYISKKLDDRNDLKTRNELDKLRKSGKLRKIGPQRR